MTWSSVPAAGGADPHPRPGSVGRLVPEGALALVSPLGRTTREPSVLPEPQSYTINLYTPPPNYFDRLSSKNYMSL